MGAPRRQSQTSEKGVNEGKKTLNRGGDPTQKTAQVGWHVVLCGGDPQNVKVTGGGVKKNSGIQGLHRIRGERKQ